MSRVLMSRVGKYYQPLLGADKNLGGSREIFPIAFSSPLHPTRRCRENLGRGSTISWPHPEVGLAMRIVSEASSILDCNFSGIRDALLRGHLRRVQQSLAWWEKRFPKRWMGAREVLFLNLKDGPAFAKRVDTAIKFSFRVVGGESLIYGGEDDCLIDDCAWGFDYFPSPFHLLPFDSGEAVPDFSLAFEARKEIDPGLAIRFKARVREFVKQGAVPWLDDLDRLSTFTCSSVMVGPWKTKPNLGVRTKNKGALDYTLDFKFMECQVFKNPHEQRACWIPDVKTLNTIKLLHKMAKRGLDCPFDYYYRRPEWAFLVEWLSERFGRVFLMSDLKKSGLTFPHSLIELLAEALKEAMPDWPWEYLLGFSGAMIFCQDKTVRRSTQGFGLGMGDPFISFAMGTLFSLWKEDNDLLKAEALFWGDDQAIRLGSPSSPCGHIDAMEATEQWDGWCKKFGLSIHEKKPFYGRRGVLLETYGEEIHPRWDSRKLGQWIPALHWALLARNISEAKLITSQVAASIWDDWWPEAIPVLNHIISYWGYEFSKDEVHLPYEIGGWITRLEGGLKDWPSVALQLPKRLWGLINLPSVTMPRMVKEGTFVDTSWVEEVRELGGPMWRKLSQGALCPPYVRPSGKRELEGWDQVFRRRKRAFRNPPPDPLVGVRKNIRNISNTRIPDEFCAQKCLGYVEIVGKPEVSGDPLRAILTLEGKGSIDHGGSCPQDLMDMVMGEFLEEGITLFDEALWAWSLVTGSDYRRLAADLRSRGLGFLPDLIIGKGEPMLPTFLIPLDLGGSPSQVVKCELTGIWFLVHGVLGGQNPSSLYWGSEEQIPRSAFRPVPQEERSPPVFFDEDQGDDFLDRKTLEIMDTIQSLFSRVSNHPDDGDPPSEYDYLEGTIPIEDTLEEGESLADFLFPDG